jgi:hypothetical protein
VKRGFSSTPGRMAEWAGRSEPVMPQTLTPENSHR